MKTSFLTQRSLLCFLLLLPLYYNGADAQPSTTSPYSLHWSVDGWIAGGGLVSAFAASSLDDAVTPLTPIEIAALQRSDVTAIDRWSAGRYSHEQSRISDVLVGGAIVSPFLFVFDPEVRKDYATLSTMYLETVLWASFTPSYGKGLARRIRPFVYSANAPMDLKTDPDARRSFFSGHATWAFATSIFFASVYSDYHPDRDNRWVWYGATGLATTVSLLRVTSGAHYLSDVAVGAAVGTAIGYGIPALHRSSTDAVSIRPSLNGLSLSVRF